MSGLGTQAAREMHGALGQLADDPLLLLRQTREDGVQELADGPLVHGVACTVGSQRLGEVLARLVRDLPPDAQLRQTVPEGLAHLLGELLDVRKLLLDVLGHRAAGLCSDGLFGGGLRLGARCLTADGLGPALDGCRRRGPGLLLGRVPGHRLEVALERAARRRLEVSFRTPPARVLTSFLATFPAAPPSPLPRPLRSAFSRLPMPPPNSFPKSLPKPKVSSSSGPAIRPLIAANLSV